VTIEISVLSRNGAPAEWRAHYSRDLQAARFPSMTSQSTLEFASEGVGILRGVLLPADILAVKTEVSLDNESLQRSGIRNLEKRFDSIARLAASPAVLSIATSCLGAMPRLVRALFFDKTPERNWFVAWHQDKTVTLNRRAEMAGWGPWSLKDGVCHVQAPCEVLNQMITIRLHIDPADEASGCLKVIPASHRLGVIKQEAIGNIVARENSIACVVAAGDAVIMRPHILHSSGKSTGSAHRRVVHLEYSSLSLPDGICWA
jgi:ectoine hydroxylase-related dioxygenase (phytanoyl-CoA dioxygenase family)